MSFRSVNFKCPNLNCPSNTSDVQAKITCKTLAYECCNIESFNDGPEGIEVEEASYHKSPCPCPDSWSDYVCSICGHIILKESCDIDLFKWLEDCNMLN